MDSVNGHLPGVVAPFGDAPNPKLLRLSAVAERGAPLRVDLADPDGGTLLHREISAPAHPKPTDCQALAETVALIIERYWHELGYELPQPGPSPSPPGEQPSVTPLPPSSAPPPPPEPVAPTPTLQRPDPSEPADGDASGRSATSDHDIIAGRARAMASRRSSKLPPANPVPASWSVAGGVIGRMGDTGATDGAVTIALGMERMLGFRLAGGVGTRSVGNTSLGDSAAFRWFPARIGASIPVVLPVGQLEPGVVVALDLALFDAGQAANNKVSFGPLPGLCTGHLCTTPGADLTLGWAVRMPHHVLFRAFAEAGLATPIQVQAMNGTASQNVIQTPRTHVALGIEWGSWFP